MKLLKRLRFWNRARRFRADREKPECDFALACIQPGQTTVDIGAHKAAFSYWMWRSVGSRGQVFAFEPQRALAEICQKFADSCGTNNVTVEQIALSDREGTGVLNIAVDDLSCGSLEDPTSNEQIKTEQVPVLSLDSYFAKIDAARPISFIKCDVEGHELEALRGGELILREDRPVVMLESFDRRNPAFQLLKEFGYVGFCFAGDQLQRLDSTNDQAATRHNFVFMHPSRTNLLDGHPPYAVEWIE